MGGNNYLSSAGNAYIMKWDPDTQSCVLQTPAKDCSVLGEAVKGINPDGSVHCVSLKNEIVDPSTYDNTPTVCSSGTYIKLEYISATKKWRATCL
jgi:hypothetical protein